MQEGSRVYAVTEQEEVIEGGSQLENSAVRDGQRGGSLSLPV